MNARWVVAGCAAVLGAVGILVVAEPTASAHPLGNISVNQAHGLTLLPDRVEDLALVDEAEIPTLQEEGRRDLDHDGHLSAAELQAHADAECPRLARGLRLRIDGRDAAAWTVVRAGAERVPGAAGLSTTRTECRFAAPVDLSRPARVSVHDGNHQGRPGWREFTAEGRGIAVGTSPVPRTSPSDGLRTYPVDLLTSPPDVRDVDLRVRPGTDGPAPAARRSTPDPIERAYASAQRRFDAAVGADHLTVGAGLAAVLLALVLGGSHAALPGHGKTIMAMYLATRGADGRRQGVRDAVTVGATVTLTHTAGVLAVGTLLTVSTSLTGERVLMWLGTASGLLVFGIGAWLLRGAMGGLRASRAEPGSAKRHGPHTHGHAHAHTHAHGHAHPHAHGHDHGHDHPHPDPHDHTSLALAETPAEPAHEGRRRTRGVLVGMGVVGGLVPSPSALVVLLGAVALGRTVFGVLLVLAYGVGMAAVLTAAGLILVRLRPTSRRPRGVWWSTYLPVATAVSVCVVGVVLTLRAAA
ncbi:HoxN/HupN/NixA family nickel/cobalt transporter [Embleya hyalina]|uniref:Nickel/cobalt efflux system RcnA n=1 Tax=Embleya hyalina TaxID=516124 RepID=A0A401YDC5_9ACTN|nr:High-affinity nickel-transporter [Embleya hyalina]GCD92604.1 Nickel/cobalt efflux system RcnA [Embleya hyalina]